MTIDFDLTFVLQMALFAALIVVLKPLLFDPMLQVFEAREALTEGVRGSARSMQEEAGALLRQYEQELSRVHQVAREERDKLRAETARLEAEQASEARAAVSRVIEQGRAEIAAQRSQLEFELGQRAERLAREVAEQALGRRLS